MLLQYLEMENVRSYVKQKVEFPGGTTLLAGDIGAGKSSVLLAIEFALFGIQRGELSGSDILRHGKDHGYVELGFDMNGKSVSIRRALRRNKKGVEQEEGWIFTGGRKLHKTPQEMRALVLEMIGYPQEYVTKNPILYRYTVYTPQDQMKSIVFEKPEERIVILRKLFGIDKYGTIRSNALIALVELRALKREKEAYAKDLEEKISERSEKQLEFNEAKKELQSASKKLLENEKNAREREVKLQAAAEELKALSHMEKTISILEDQASQLAARKEARLKELHQLAQRELQLKKHAMPQRPTESTEEELVKRSEVLKQKSREVLSRKSVIESEIRRITGIMERGMCEFCGQIVKDKNHFQQEMDARKAMAENIAADAELLEKEARDAELLISSMKDYRYALLNYQKTQQDLRDVWSRRQAAEKEARESDIALANARFQSDQLRTEAQKLPEIREKEGRARKEFAEAQAAHLEAAKSYSRLDASAKAMEMQIELYEKDIAGKERARSESKKTGEVISWVETFFLPLMEKIEQAIMHTLQQEFCNYFQEWFSILMQSENMNVSVDRDFTPLIEQQGYSTEYQNLSGGEKTSVALAYRLALNKVINSLVESIMTKDLIILDEPTDGFSAEQIDRIRDVLLKLNLRQMIVVSHEPKIDTFVDHVIRFYKEGHVSRAVAG